MTKKYIIKPKYNGVGKKEFDDPEEAVKFFEEYTLGTMPSFMGTLEEKLEQLLFIKKLEIIDG